MEARPAVAVVFHHIGRTAVAFESKCFGEGLEGEAKLAPTLPRKQAGLFDRALLSAVLRYTS